MVSGDHLRGTGEDEMANTSSFLAGFPRNNVPCVQLIPQWRQSSLDYTRDMQKQIEIRINQINPSLTTATTDKLRPPGIVRCLSYH